jgi:hypothetical protein
MTMTNEKRAALIAIFAASVANRDRPTANRVALLLGYSPPVDGQTIEEILAPAVDELEAMP